MVQAIAIETKGLGKAYRGGLKRKAFTALDALDLGGPRGQVSASPAPAGARAPARPRPGAPGRADLGPRSDRPPPGARHHPPPEAARRDRLPELPPAFRDRDDLRPRRHPESGSPRARRHAGPAPGPGL